MKLKLGKNMYCIGGVIGITIVLIFAMLFVAPSATPFGILGDFDGDGIINFADPDDDNDGIPDETDPDPFDPETDEEEEDEEDEGWDGISLTFSIVFEWAIADPVIFDVAVCEDMFGGEDPPEWSSPPGYGLVELYDETDSHYLGFPAGGDYKLRIMISKEDMVTSQRLWYYAVDSINGWQSSEGYLYDGGGWTAGPGGGGGYGTTLSAKHGEQIEVLVYIWKQPYDQPPDGNLLAYYYRGFVDTWGAGWTG